MTRTISNVLNSNKEQPCFNYLVQVAGNVGSYWLYDSFDKAYNKMKELSRQSGIAYILEPYFSANKREWLTIKSFYAFDGEGFYAGRGGEIMLHAEFYINAGTWENDPRPQCV